MQKTRRAAQKTPRPAKTGLSAGRAFRGPHRWLFGRSSSRAGENPSTATTSSTAGAPGATGIGRSGAGVERLVAPLETKATLDPIAGLFVARGRERTETVSGENQLGDPGLLAEESRLFECPAVTLA